MSSPVASTERQPRTTDRVGDCTSLKDALVKLRFWTVLAYDGAGIPDHDVQVEVGDEWDMGQGLGIVLLNKPSSTNTPARLAATATTSATGLPASLFRSTSSAPPPPPLAPTASTSPAVPAPVEPSLPEAISPPEAAQASSSNGSTALARPPGASTSAEAATALCDFLARRLHAAIASSPTAWAHGIHSDYNQDTVGQFVLETNRAEISSATGTVSVVFDLYPVSGSGGRDKRPYGSREQNLREKAGRAAGGGEQLLESVRGIIKRALLNSAHTGGGLDVAAACAHVESVEDQGHLRGLVAASDGVAFIADGSILPRRGGSDDRPMETTKGAIPFKSPESLRKDFCLPHGGIVTGMLVPRGVTVIVGGGFHGKSTLLRALAVGVYNKVPGDGRELAVTDPDAVTIRAEDGRPVSRVDISPFISSLPSASGAVAAGRAASDAAGTEPSGRNDGDKSKAGVMTTERFSTRGASGSTSQAANVVEALEAGATALLLDEDTCAGNFMIRDSRMRAMVHHEPITPFIYRVSSLWLELGVSSVIVIGGCGDYFDVHDTAILVDNYVVSDATERAHSISRRFCVGRVQYAGRGLVHRLPWPGNLLPRAIVPESVLRPSRRGAGVVTTAKRKRDRVDSNGASVFGGEENVVAGDGGNCCGDGHEPTSNTTLSNGRIPLENNNGQQAPAAAGTSCEIRNGVGCGEKGPGEKAVTIQQGGGDGGGGGGHQETIFCDCPCFCDRGRSHTIPSIHADSGKVGPAAIADARIASADLSRVEQLVGGAAMVRGCALGVEFLARATERSPSLSVSGALDLLQTAIANPTAFRGGGAEDGNRERGDNSCGGGGGGLKLLYLLATGEEVEKGHETQSEQQQQQRHQQLAVLSFCGGPLVALPRRLEVAAALHRLPGVDFRSAGAAVPGRVEPALSEGAEAA